MITLEERIARTQRLLRRLDEDQPYLHVRLSPLGAEHRESANAFADRLRAEAVAELQRLLAERETGQVSGVKSEVSGEQSSETPLETGDLTAGSPLSATLRDAALGL